MSSIERTDERIFFHSQALDNSCEECHGAMLDDEISMGELLSSQVEKQRVRDMSHGLSIAECSHCHSKLVKIKGHAPSRRKTFFHSKVDLDLCHSCHTQTVQNKIIYAELTKSKEHKDRVKLQSHSSNMARQCTSCHLVIKL